jgi:hypothetical protein
MPGFLDINPHRFQGAYARVWDESKLGTNDPNAANNSSMILSAYDVEEKDTIGFIGLGNIPKITTVAGNGVHEPNLQGDRLYLAAYNAGARRHGDAGTRGHGELETKAPCCEGAQLPKVRRRGDDPLSCPFIH